MRRLLILGIGVYALTVVGVVAASMVMQERHLGGRSLHEPVDAAIVLGGGVEPDGVLSYSTRRRVAAGVGLLRDGLAARLILSGGIHPGSRTSAALLMHEHAVGLGAPPGALLLEERSRTTFENLRFAFDIAGRDGLGRLALVTDNMHLARADALAHYFGRPEIGLVAVRGLEWQPWYIVMGGTMREALAWWYNLGKVGAWTLLDAAGIAEHRRGDLVH